MAQSPEEPINMSRTLTVPAPTTVTPTVWVQARQGPMLADLIAQPGTTRARGDSDVIDVLGSAYAATDGDPRTAWVAPQSIVQFRTAANLTVQLPNAAMVSGLRLAPSASDLPAHPTLVAVDLGTGPQVRRLTGNGPQTLTLKPALTDTVKLSILDWRDVIDRTALGFDQVKPPGLAEVTALDAHGAPIAPADAASNLDRAVSLPCGKGPIIAVAGQFLQTSVHTTVGALLDSAPIPAQPCQSAPLHLPAGQQELVISPGSVFTIVGVQLATPSAGQLHGAATTPAALGHWTADHREVQLPASPEQRVLVVPESVNPGWSAHTANGTTLTPVTVNGWQQGWVLPAGSSGTLTLEFTSNALYRVGLFGGLALLPLLALLALWPTRRPSSDDAPLPWRPPIAVAGAVLVGVGALIAGAAGAAVLTAAIGLRYLLRSSPRLLDNLTVGVAAGGMTLAGAVLSVYPWRSVDGYIGDTWGVQLLALISVATVAASLLTVPVPAPEDQ